VKEIRGPLAGVLTVLLVVPVLVLAVVILAVVALVPERWHKRLGIEAR
jgi:hypothetical protein